MKYFNTHTYTYTYIYKRFIKYFNMFMTYWHGTIVLKCMKGKQWSFFYKEKYCLHAHRLQITHYLTYLLFTQADGK